MGSVLWRRSSLVNAGVRAMLGQKCASMMSTWYRSNSRSITSMSRWMFMGFMHMSDGAIFGRVMVCSYRRAVCMLMVVVRMSNRLLILLDS